MFHRTLFKGFAVLVLVPLILGSIALGQETADRKVKTRIEPSYPEIARSMHLSGAVKILVTITPAGTVKSTKVIGGSPVFVESALAAVGKWRFEAGKDETTQVVTFNFHI